MRADRDRDAASARVRRGLRRVRALGTQGVLTAVFLVLAFALAAGVERDPRWFSPSVFVLLLLVATSVLRWRTLVVVVAAVLVLATALALAAVPTLTPGAVVVLLLACAAVLVFAWERERLGLQGAPGALMLVDLRDRLSAGGRVPPLPVGWHVDVEVRSAHGAGFSGDFVVTRLAEGHRLEIALVDVSGKGQAAGVRSLQLSGALGGLLGAMSPPRFLPAANDYLLDQRWDEGFATAVHLAVDLRTGGWSVASAGHPPPIRLDAASGRLELLTTAAGPALGVVDAIRPEVRTGTFARGDAIVLYTDGLVESPGRDVDQGIDRLLGVVEQVVSARGGSASAVLAGARAAEDDDRAVVVVRRR
ncbi:PP2C family protein-serine/threonine phosphatase [Cellulomonas shaoxiangyii]|uniref:PP2C family protein-serine/threonine phosphatase n=1 Tax=Cellulomonas shaoxiangyii TaxID=2566013 RepID=UPI001FB7938F|nr:PP2C family protein-serine/threonine phosphatase [Cellulomonas shaoxiangyii]